MFETKFSIINIQRVGRPDVKFSTVFEVTSELMQDLKAHIERVESRNRK